MNKSQIEKRLPELKPNSEPQPKFQRPAKITPNPMLCAVLLRVGNWVLEFYKEVFVL